MLERSYRPVHQLLSVLLVAQLALMVVAFGDRSASLLWVVLTGVLFVAAHLVFTPSHIFLAEFTDQFGRGEPQPVDFFGTNLLKRLEVKFPPEASLRSLVDNRGIAAAAVGGAVLLAARHTHSASVGLVLFLLFGVWAFSVRRAFLWLPIAGAGVFLTLIFTKENSFRLLAIAVFFVYYSTYRHSLLTWASASEPNPFASGVRQAVKPFLIFAAVFALAAFVLPDRVMRQKLQQTRGKLARQMGRHYGRSGFGGGPQGQSGSPNTGQALSEQSSQPTQNGNSPESDNSQAQSGNPKTGNSDSTGGSSDRTGSQAPLANRLDTKPQSTLSEQSSPGANRNSDGSGGPSDGAGTQAAPSASAPDSASQPQTLSAQRTPPSRPLQPQPPDFDTFLRHLENVLRVVLVLGIALIAWRFWKKPAGSQVSDEERKKRSRARHLALQQIHDLQSRHFASQREEVIAAYHAYLVLVAANGFIKQDWQTPQQFVTEAVKHGEPLRAISPNLTQLFSKVYYGQEALSQEEYSQFKKCVRQIVA